MMNFYVYKTATGILKISDAYVAGHVLKIMAKNLTGAKIALTNYKKMLNKEDGKSGDKA
jgi:hypothetical protein